MSSHENLQQEMSMKKTIVITGASDGIGAEAARQLKELGHQVILVGRNPIKTQRMANILDAPCHVADFAKLKDVARLAKELSAYPKIDVLANNAGGLQNEKVITEDGYESTFQINVLAQFLLTTLLADKLCECGTTVIQTTSIASNLFGMGLDLDNLQNENTYTPIKAYGEAKLCNALFTRELQKRYGEKGLCAVAFEPGIPRTNFASEGPAFFRVMYHTPFKYLFTNSVKGSAKRLVRLALGVPGEDFTPGEVYSYKRVYKVKYIRRMEAEIKDPSAVLWKKCEEMVK